MPANSTIPHYREWGPPEDRITPSEAETSQERRSERLTALRTAVSMDDRVRTEYKEAGLEPLPDDVNLGIMAITEFRKRAHEAASLAELIKVSTPKERVAFIRLYAERKREVDQYLEYGPNFERDYREYLREVNKTAALKLSLRQINALENALQEPLVGEDEGSKLGTKTLARLEAALRSTSDMVLGEMSLTLEVEVEALNTIYGVDPNSPPEVLGSEQLVALDDKQKETYQTKQDNWSAYKEATDGLLKLDRDSIEPLRSRADIQKEIERLKKQSGRLWGDGMVRNIWEQNELRGFIDAIARGDDVLETESVVDVLNRLHEIEEEHNNTIGGVLIGPPGVGKTTIIKHYLEQTGREAGYIDLSQDVTRYVLYGSKSIEFKSPTDRFKELATLVEGLDEKTFIEFIRSNAGRLTELEALKQKKGGKGDFEVASFVAILGMELEEAVDADGLSEEVRALLQGAKEKLVGLANNAFADELGAELAHIIKKNGWRDGFVINCLREGICPLFDEFPQFKGWEALHSLMTAKPGEMWQFGDNNEKIHIPDHWRMYFTGNIGPRYNSPVIPDNLSQRVQHAVINVGYPPTKEEMRVMWAMMSNPNGEFLRSRNDFAKLAIFISTCLPNLRPIVEKDRQSIPISYRTLRYMAEKLVATIDRKSRKPIYAARPASFDSVLWQVLIESQGLYESKEASRLFATELVTAGLLLEPEMRENVVELVGESFYEDALKAHPPGKLRDDLDTILQKQFGIKPRGKKA